MKRGAESIYKTEADLCAAFIAWAAPKGWTAYAETAGWDILLVHTSGWQIGVQAKLRFNMAVIAQTIETWYGGSDEGPDFRAILVPRRDGYADLIGGALGFGVFEPTELGKEAFSPDVSVRRVWGHWHYWNPVRRCKLPDYVPDVPAGDSGPVQLTDWKVRALRICAVLELRGFVTRADFRHFSVDIRRWAGPRGWLVPMPGNEGCYVGAKSLRFAEQHPVVYPQVRDEVRSYVENVLLPTRGKQLVPA